MIGNGNLKTNETCSQLQGAQSKDDDNGNKTNTFKMHD